MTLMLIGMAIFFAVHLSLRLAQVQALKVKLGMPFKGIFALLALASFVLIIIGYMQFRPIAPDIFAAPKWAKLLNTFLAIPAFILLVAAYMKGRISSTLKHPQLVGVALWAFGHLLANGDQASVLLFGGFMIWSVITIVLQPKIETEMLKWCRNDEASIAFGILFWVAIGLKLHPIWFGVSAFGA